MNDLTGQVVLVTGGGRGVGRGLALALGSAGARVVIATRRVEPGEAVVAELEAAGADGLAVGCDVSRLAEVRAAVAAAVDRFDRLDHIVHNATSARSSEVADLASLDPGVWEEHSAVALRALHHLAREAGRHLVAARGSLLVLTSPAGVEGSGTLPLYATVKAGQRGFVKALAREWGPSGVRVNGLAPLAVSPALANAFLENVELEARLAAATPLGRVGDPATDIGPAAVFLCSGAARYITGQTLVVSGGRFTAL